VKTVTRKSKFHLLEEKTRRLNIKPLKVYLIGGGNLALRGLKSATKDIDIIILDERQFSIMQSLLETPIPKMPVYVRQYQSQWNYNLGMSSRYSHFLYGFNLEIFVESSW